MLSAVMRLCLFALLVWRAAAPLALAQEGPRSRAERSNFEETSTFADVEGFLAALRAASPLVRVQSFGSSEEGRALPLAILSQPAVETPEAARRLGRPVVLVFANIHAGEVEGKEAAQHLARRLTLGDLRPLLDRLVVLVVPVYNADGNERVDPAHRASQHGPVGGVGQRANARGLDLNRDFVKLDAPESRALVGLLTGWDPAVVVDLHTTNGSYHGYHLTYAPALSPNTDPALTAFMWDTLLPAVTARLKADGWRSFHYGNFSTREAIARESDRPAEGQGTRAWRTYDARPRFGVNYIGLRNRIALLSEAYSYLAFDRRVAVTEAFVAAVLQEVAGAAKRLTALIAAADRAATGLSGSGLAATSEITADPEPVEILVGEVEPRPNPRTGRPMTAMREDVARPERMLHYGRFRANATAVMPAAYLIDGSVGGGAAAARAGELLRWHGIRTEAVRARTAYDVDAFTVEKIDRSPRPFQGRHEVRLTGAFASFKIDAPAGSLLVRTNQPLARLIFQLLEPQSEDGFVTWGLLDEWTAEGKGLAVYKVHRGP